MVTPSAQDPSRAEIRLGSGPLALTPLLWHASILPHKADFTLHAGGDLAGHCHFDRDPATGLETLWDIVVAPGFQRRGLASLLVRLALRRLLLTGPRHWFAMRAMMRVDTSRPGSPTLQNVGIGRIALRLGLLPAPGLDRILTPAAVRSLTLLDPSAEAPPGWLIRLETLPGILTAVRLDPKTGSPAAGLDDYRRFVSPESLRRQAQTGEVLLGNTDYELPSRNADRLAAALADTETEFRRILTALRRSPLIRRRPPPR